MSLFGIANSLVQGINPDIPVTILRPSGYVIAPGGKRTPNVTSIGAMLQVQSLAGEALKHANNLNLQGVLRQVSGACDLRAIDAASGTGCDELIFVDPADGVTKRWRVVSTLESWGGWSRVIAQQVPNA